MSLEHQSTPDQSTEPEVGQRIVEATVDSVSFLPGMVGDGEGQSFIRTVNGVALLVPGRINLSEGEKIKYLDRPLSTRTDLGETAHRYSFLGAVSTS